MIDTLRSDHLPSYGYEEELTPFLSGLFSQGVQLQGYSASSWTRPSVATFLTGLYPQRHQAIGRKDHLPAGTPFLPELLQGAGLNTAAYVGNSNVGEEVGFARGWDLYREHIAGGGKKPDAVTVTDQALEFAGQLTPPFFLYVHYIDPHAPYLPRQVWGMPEVDRSEYVQPNDFLREKYPLDADEMEQMRAQYNGEIHEMDAQLERLLEGLKQLGRLEGTLFVLTADHGEAFGEHGTVAHGQNLHEELIRVPFLLWMESGMRSYRSPAPFHHIDFLPTILDALDLSSVQGLDGTSRWKEITDAPPSESRAGLFHLDLDHLGELGLRSGSQKLIYRIRGSRELLYDLSLDPGERGPLPDRPRLRRELLRTAVERHNALSEEAFGQKAASLSPSLAARLAALGYISKDDDEEESVRVIPRQLELPQLALPSR